jgi:hypothetical protein
MESQSHIRIRKATANDIDNIMGFIKNSWLDTHILANHREFLEYQHKYQEEVTYIIAEKLDTSEIKAILGYIPYGKTNRDVMTAMWKANHSGNPFLGVEVLNYLLLNIDSRIVSCCGINKKAEAIYRYLGFQTGKLEHYYRLSNRDTFRIADIKDKTIIPINQLRGYSLVKMESFYHLKENFDFYFYKESSPKPYKEPWYLEKRYFNHPVYTYNVYGIKNLDDNIHSVLFTREVLLNGVKILRIVDFIGNTGELKYISCEIQNLIDKYNYEYIDFYQHGIDKDIMNSAGFTLKSETNNMIPNYFEPFVAENIDINYFTTGDDKILIFKGDGDQDRPNYYVRREGI